MNNSVSHKRYYTLDAIRGVAALIVVLRHSTTYWGNIHFSQSYLAVDLFFALSGFVIAEAYSNRIAGGLTVKQFMKMRIIRLYPLYILGTVIGLVAAIGSVLVGKGVDKLTLPDIGEAFLCGLFFLPYYRVTLYPLNHPAWSLLFELAVNFLYALFHRFCTTKNLVIVAVLSAIALVLCAFNNGSFDGGWLWKNFYVGIPRVVYSFTVGLLLHRLPRNLLSFRIPSLIPIALIVAMLCYEPSENMQLWYSAFIVLALFPCTLYVASISNPRSRMATNIYSFLGMTSYAIYALHSSLAALGQSFIRAVFKIDIVNYAPYSGFLLLVVLLISAWVLDVTYDQWARRKLTVLTK